MNIDLSRIPQHFVKRHYDMNPDTEDLLFNGTFLKDGMIVLVENPLMRVNMKAGMPEWKQDLANLANRWCMVDHVSFHDASVSFIAIYGDGTKRKRVYGNQAGWFVKLDSMIPQDEMGDHEPTCDHGISVYPHCLAIECPNYRGKCTKDECLRISPFVPNRVLNRQFISYAPTGRPVASCGHRRRPYSPDYCTAFHCHNYWGNYPKTTMPVAPACGHPIDTHSPYCTTPDCHNYAGRFIHRG